MCNVQIEGNSFSVRFRYDDLKDGRLTTCMVKINNGEDLLLGEALCSPKDQFVKATGRKISLTRALEPLNRDVRTAIWEAYLEKANV